jgi:aspartokinase-like uncharacterized kinase
LKATDELPHTWDVTSDSIALWIGKRTRADIVILLKSVDGIVDPSQETQILNRVEADNLHIADTNIVVDRFLPQLVPKFEGRVFVVNGTHCERLSHILSGQETICTEIIQ